MYSSGDSGDPCGTPAGVAICPDFEPLNCSCVLLPCKTLATHDEIAWGIRRFRRLCMSRLWCTLLKAPATSMNIAVYIFLFFHALYVSPPVISLASHYLSLFVY